MDSLQYPTVVIWAKAGVLMVDVMAVNWHSGDPVWKKQMTQDEFMELVKTYLAERINHTHQCVVHDISIRY